MSEATSSTQLPPGAQKSVVQEELEAFQQGLELGKQYADVAARRVAAWAEENPGQMLLAGLAAGFIVGKIFFRPRRRLPDFDLD